MRAALERHGGTVEKFIGDAVVGVFGVPVAHEDDALRACRAALEMQARLGALNAEPRARFGTGIEVRIGVNTRRGGREPGDVRDRRRRQRRRPARAGGAAPGEVLLGEETYRLVRDAVRVEPVEPIAAKGKSEPLTAFRLLEASATGGAARRARRSSDASAELALLEREFDARRRRAALPAGDGRRRGRRRQVAAAASSPPASATGRGVVRGACLSYGEGITYWAVAPDRARARRHPRRAHRRGGPRERVPPRIAQLLGLAEGSTTADQTAEAIAEFLAAAAAEQPLVVLVDDIHWAEPALLDLLAALPARSRGAGPAALPGAAGAARAPPRLAGHGRLEPLGAADVDALLESLEAPPSVRVRLALAAAGNPLFAEELVAWVA